MHENSRFRPLIPIKIPSNPLRPESFLTKVLQTPQISQKPLRKSQSKQEFRRPMITSSKLPPAFQMFRKGKNILDDDHYTQISQGSPLSAALSPSVPLFQPSCLKKLFEKSQEATKPSIKQSKFKAFEEKFPAFHELIEVKTLKRSVFSCKKMVFHAQSSRVFLLEEIPLRAGIKEDLQEIQRKTLTNPNFVQIYQVFFNCPEGFCSVLQEYMNGGCLEELLSFAVTLNEKTLSEMLASLKKIPFIQEENLDPSRIFFDKQGKIKVSLSFKEKLQKKKPKVSLENLILACIFGDFSTFFPEKMKKKLNSQVCCAIHETNNPLLLGIFDKFSTNFQRNLCKILSKNSLEDFETGNKRQKGAGLVELLRISSHWKDFAGDFHAKKTRFSKFLKGFTALVGCERDILKELYEKIDENHAAIKEISEVFMVKPGDLLKNLRECFIV